MIYSFFRVVMIIYNKTIFKLKKFLLRKIYNLKFDLIKNYIILNYLNFYFSKINFNYNSINNFFLRFLLLKNHYFYNYRFLSQLIILFLLIFLNNKAINIIKKIKTISNLYKILIFINF